MTPRWTEAECVCTLFCKDIHEYGARRGPFVWRLHRTLATLGEGGAGRKRLLAETARRGVKPWHPEKRLAVAADLSSAGVGNACHRDTLRYLFA